MKSTLSLGERIKKALEGPPKKTQRALAAYCHIDPVSVNDWVHDRTKTIEGVHLLKAAAFLGVSARWLADGTGPMNKTEAQIHAETTKSALSFTSELLAAALRADPSVLRQAENAARVVLDLDPLPRLENTVGTTAPPLKSSASP